MTSKKCIHFLIMLPSLIGFSIQQETIPENLLECYNDSVTLMPMTINNFIEIIKKIEAQQYSIMSMNMVVNLLVHRFWRDGIVLDRNIIVLEPEVIPFRTTGFQSYKYELIKHNILPQITSIYPQDFLSSSEKCTLHHMLSGSIDIWERGNEDTVCLIYHDSETTNFEPTGFRKSSCPIEKGVLTTKYFGTVSPIHILLSISSVLEPMSIPISYLLRDGADSVQNKSIDNKYISLIGDLAEVLIIQTPLVKNEFQFGPGGNWNDSVLPVEYYMKLSKEALQKELWQFTDAEILGALDGLLMAEEVQKWETQGRLLRLSQLLEAYYSSMYTFVAINTHACKRNTAFEALMNKKEEIIKQVQTFAEVLINKIPNYLNNTSVIQSRSEELIHQFNNYVNNVLWKPVKCTYGVYTKSKVKLNIVFDNSWSSYENIQFLMALAESIDVSEKGSQISIILGDSGQTLIDSANSLEKLYENWNMIDVKGIPSIVDSLLSIMNNLLNKETDSSLDLSESYSYVTVIIAMTTILVNEDISTSVKLIESIRRINPDMRFIYITSLAHAPMFVKLTSAAGSQMDRIITAERSRKNFIIEELSSLSDYPTAITPPACGNLTKEAAPIKLNGYANQGIILYYRIHPYYLYNNKRLEIEVQNDNKGNIIVCITIGEGYENEDWKEDSISEKLMFTIRNPCSSRTIYGEQESWDDNCKPIYIRIYGKRSLSTCTDWLCRMPDDIPFKLIIHGMGCTREDHSLYNSSINNKMNVILLILMFYIALQMH